LARASIATNVISGARHDHLFVPFERREDALAVLDELTVGGRVQRPAGPHVPRTDGVPEVELRDGEIRLGQFLKLAGLVDSGSAVKPLLAYGRVKVNDEPETRRGRQLRIGDVVTVDGRAVAVG
jgi:ribosome-associated protein